MTVPQFFSDSSTQSSELGIKGADQSDFWLHPELLHFGILLLHQMKLYKALRGPPCVCCTSVGIHREVPELEYNSIAIQISF